MRQFIDSGAGNGRLKADRVLLETALNDVQAMAGTLTSYLMASQEQPSELYKVGLASVRFLYAVGDLLIAWRLLVQAEVALTALDHGASAKDQSFYRGKVVIASYFAKNVLPILSSTKEILGAIDNEIMELDEEAF